MVVEMVVDDDDDGNDRSEAGTRQDGTNYFLARCASAQNVASQDWKARHHAGEKARGDMGVHERRDE
ncbi:hypothetical protein RhiXN_11403 [Rhizoctonia solani]|uniref:Uncharacterized protein n=1 Tax=Rhizoctonia solani TaxID=456999 RepID=A0A8H8SZN5_9AGAM|nr:uncharacterized protein RhiXN_11403 [Rhizoctonia solani]QRW24491.1 hypothetical protein RhiXN_11403 [Rhizoctonia solani]